jgi:hypothetical protein
MKIYKLRRTVMYMPAIEELEKEAQQAAIDAVLDRAWCRGCLPRRKVRLEGELFVSGEDPFAELEDGGDF